MFGCANQVPLSYYVSSLVAGKSLAGSDECVNKVLKTGSVTFGHFNPDEIKNLPTDYVPDPNHLVHQGDVLISRMNTPELVGAVAYVDVSIQNTYLPDRLWRAELKANANGIFIWQALSEISSKGQIRRLASGTSGSMKNISKLQMLSIAVPLVSLDLQNQFADFVRQVDKSKFILSRMTGLLGLSTHLDARSLQALL